MTKSTGSTAAAEARTVYPVHLIADWIKTRAAAVEYRRREWETAQEEYARAAVAPPEGPDPLVGLEGDELLAALANLPDSGPSPQSLLRDRLRRIADADATINAYDRTIQALLEGRPLPNE